MSTVLGAPRLHHVDRGVVKSMGHRERIVHALVAAELPDVTAAILPLTSEDPAADTQLVLMERLDGAAPLKMRSQALTPGALLDGGLGALARLHVHFAGQADRLEALGLTSPSPPPDPSPILVPFLANAFRTADREFGGAYQVRLHTAIVGSEQAYEALARRTELTLVHGDLHLGNLIGTSKETVRILDWESACLGLPVWDLVACPPDHIDSYLRQLCALTQRRIDRGAFHQDLRNAIIVRMLDLLTTLTRLYAEATPDWAASMLAIACVERMFDNMKTPLIKHYNTQHSLSDLISAPGEVTTPHA